jgi:basic membrane protein A and related proteins
MRKAVRVVAVLATVAVFAAACGKKNEPGASASGGAAGGGSTIGAGKQMCEVTDTGGINDKSFNATAYKGLTDAQNAFGITPKYLQSDTAADYAPNIQAFLGKCDLLVTVGFLLGPATETAAKANPSQKFAIVDFAYDPTIKNVLGLTFSTNEAAFLAGYVAAGMSKSGKIGTFGGLNIPTVTIFMNGLAAGILKYNQDNNANVQLLGWDPVKQNGTFTGDFEDQNKGRQVTESLLSEGADIIMPVAGPVGLGAAAAVQDAGNGAMLIGVDTDWYTSAPQYRSIELTSVEKRMDVAVEAAVDSTLKGTFKGGLYNGTLKNDGVGIAPFHNFDSQVPQDLKTKVDELKKGIIDGTVSVDPKDYAS